MMSILMAGVLSAAAHAAAPPSLAKLKNKNRVVVVLVDTADNAELKTTRLAFATEKKGSDERALVLIEELGAGPLHEYFKVKDGFAAVLVGKDGGEKWRGGQAVEPKLIFHLIDQMPMRQSEMKGE